MSELTPLFESDLMSTISQIGTDVSRDSSTFAKNPSKATRLSALDIQSFAPMKNIALPLNYNNLLEVFLAASRNGEVFPYYVRQMVTVKAGSIGELVTTIPPGDVASVVYLLKLHADTYSSEFLVTLQSDSFPPLFVEAPLNNEIDILGAFLPPAKTQGVYTLVNNDTIDITFTADVQIAVMTSSFVREVYNPLITGQYKTLGDLGALYNATKESVLK